MRSRTVIFRRGHDRRVPARAGLAARGGDHLHSSGSRINVSEQRDFVVEDHGCIFLLQPLTPFAREWVEENIPEESLKWAGATVVEYHDIRDVLMKITDAGGVCA